VSHGYQAVSWNRQKGFYDLAIAAGVTIYLGLFIAVGSISFPYATPETLIIRGSGSAAFILLHVVLCIKVLTAWSRDRQRHRTGARSSTVPSPASLMIDGLTAAPGALHAGQVAGGHNLAS